MTQKRTILLIGKTGSGKSTLANVLLNKDDEFVEVFKVSDSVNSETKESQIAEFEHGGINYKVIDTIGLADTRFSREEVLKKWKEFPEIAERVNQILFVTQGRFTDEELKCYEMVSKEIFEEKASDYLTIVRTDFSNFSNKEECEKDIRKIREETDEEGQVNQARIKMINSCKAFVHISNPPLNIAKGTSNDTNDGDTSDEESKEEERKSKISLNKKERQRSRKKLLNHLKKCEKTYKTKWRIYKEECDKLEEEISTTKERSIVSFNKLQGIRNSFIDQMEFEKQINLYSNATNLAFISTALASIYLPPLWFINPYLIGAKMSIRLSSSAVSFASSAYGLKTKNDYIRDFKKELELIQQDKSLWIIKDLNKMEYAKIIVEAFILYERQYLRWFVDFAISSYNTGSSKNSIYPEIKAMDKQIAKTQATIDNISIEEKPELFEIIKQYPNRWKLLEKSWNKNIQLESWKNINSNFTSELVQEWKNHGFTYEECADWINTNAPSKHSEEIQKSDYYAWLRDVKKVNVEWVLNHGNSKELGKEFFEWWQENQSLETKVEQLDITKIN